MENASKALIMAASVLLGVMLLSLGAYLITTFSSFAEEVAQENASKQLTKFNAQFLTYQDENKEITIYDIITVANYAKEYNLNNNNAQDLYITVEATVKTATGNKRYTNLEKESAEVYNDILKYEAENNQGVVTRVYLQISNRNSNK